MKKAFLIAIPIMLSILLVGCNTESYIAVASQEKANKEQPTSMKYTDKANEESIQTEANNDVKANILYDNADYGFTFSLPNSWSSYKVVTDTWEGIDINQQEKMIGSGPILSIRHPLWTEENPRQDIPIMVFTHEQWSSLKKEEFVIGAAPILPKILGENDNYVFALPARYNFAFPEGYEEVEDIIESNPLQTK